MISLIAYGFILSGIIGFISSIFLVLVNGFIDFLWVYKSYELKIPALYTLLLSVLGGVLVGMSRKKWGNLPEIAQDPIVKLKTTLRIDYSTVFLNLLITFLILVFGASVRWSCGSSIKRCNCVISMARR